MKKAFWWVFNAVVLIVIALVFLNVEPLTRIQIMLALVIVGIYSLLAEAKNIKTRIDGVSRHVETLRKHGFDFDERYD